MVECSNESAFREPLARHVAELLAGAGLPTGFDPRRGYDHGTFVPLYVMYPDASVPVVQLSLREGYDPDEHLAAGRAIASLRDENVLIVGSGSSFHNLRLFGAAGRDASHDFDAWLHRALVDGPVAERDERLRNWESAPSARLAHPWEEHLMPLHVVAGAAEGERAVVDFHDREFFGGIAMTNFRFGELPAAVPA